MQASAIQAVSAKIAPPVIPAPTAQPPASMALGQTVCQALLRDAMPPQGFPVLSADISLPLVGLEKFIGNLENRNKSTSLGRPGRVSASSWTPYELTCLAFHAGVRAVTVHQMAIEHPGLLDLHMFMVG